VNLGAAAASLFAIGYGQHEHSPQRVLPFYPAFLAAMNLVVLADDASLFLVSWKSVTVLLGTGDGASPRSREQTCGYVYIVMASFGTLCLLLAFGLLAGGTGVMHLPRCVAAPNALSGLVLIPCHPWRRLEGGSGAAARLATARASGCAKPRFGADERRDDQGRSLRLHPYRLRSQRTTGLVVERRRHPTCRITCVLGVLSALMQHDLKRLLAYPHRGEYSASSSSALASALAFSAHHMPSAAALAMTAALFHVLNHSIFKSLLFFGSGAVLTATGQRDMEQLGGLIHRMPLTAFTFLAGCMAISALAAAQPASSSEWLTFQAILLSPEVPSWGVKLIVPAVGAMLALSAALAAACFVKASA